MLHAINELPPHPRKGDLLFRDDLPDWIHNATLNIPFGGDIGYLEGYRRGAECLIQSVIETQSGQDFLVYPIVFLYRHHIELILKRMILRAPYLLSEPLTKKQKTNLGKHRLDLLWQDLKPMISDIAEKAGWGTLDQEDINGVDDYIRQLAALDRDSFSFRYALSKNGDPSLPADLKRINLRHFGEMMTRLASFLDGIDSGTDHLADLQAEMDADMGSYAGW
jgi:hypothetical protein